MFISTESWKNVSQHVNTFSLQRNTSSKMMQVQSICIYCEAKTPCETHAVLKTFFILTHTFFVFHKYLQATTQVLALEERIVLKYLFLYVLF